MLPQKVKKPDFFRECLVIFKNRLIFTVFSFIFSSIGDFIIEDHWKAVKNEDRLIERSCREISCQGGHFMDRVARVTEIIGASNTSFDDAIKVGFERANRTLRNITGLRVLEQRVAVEGEKMVEYRVRMEVIFLLET